MMHLLVIQYAGDYREAYQRINNGEGETYYAQRYSIDAVASLQKYFDRVTVLCCCTDALYDEVLDNGVRAIGAGLQDSFSGKQVLPLLSPLKPDRLLLRFPMREILTWAIQQRIPTLATLADSFSQDNWRQRIRNYLLARKLNHPQVEWVGNHGFSSCKSLVSIGVSPSKVIPWDWPPSATPYDFQAKHLDVNCQDYQVFFAGSVTEQKGVGDLLDALSILNDEGFPVSLMVAGKGDIDYFEQKSQGLGIQDQVTFLGLVKHTEILDLMRRSDVVVVPSRHEYPEGLPMTIYESFCARTPLVASDHPMFQERICHNVNALIFPEQKPSHLAICIKQLLTDSSLYARISEETLNAWESLQVPVKWGELIDKWSQNTAHSEQWLRQHTLAV